MPPSERAGGASWDHGVLAKLAGLAGARLGAQALSLAWFLFAARVLDAPDFGVLSTGLVLVIVIGGLSDLGTTRTVVRYVAGTPSALRSVYLRAVALRAGGGVVVGTLAVLLTPLGHHGIATWVVVVSALIAIASGITEVGFASLRAVALVRAEVALLVSERALFGVAGVVLLQLGYGPLAVLIAYAITNGISAAIVTARILRHRPGVGTPSGPLLDPEGRRTAVISSLVIVGPRLSALLLVVMVSPTVVGTFAIAQKIPDALGTVGSASLLPVLAMVRAAVVTGGRRHASERGARATAAVVAVVAPVSVWLAIAGKGALDLLFDAGDRPYVVPALAILAVASVIYMVRTLGELMLLAEERAAAYVTALAVGAATNIAVGIVLIRHYGAAGAAAALLAGELVVFLCVVRAERELRTSAVVRVFAPALITTAGSVATSFALRGLPVVAGMAATGLWCAVGLLAIGRRLRDDGGPGDGSGADRDHADVGEEVGGHLRGDGIETVEHLARPADHL